MPPGTHVSWASGSGIYVSGQDFVPPDPDDHSGRNFRDGVDPIPAMGADATMINPRLPLALVTALVFGIAAGGRAAAEPPDAAKIVSPDAYPAGMQHVLHRATAGCKASGDSGLTFPADAVRAFDLIGDGRDDYLISYHGAERADSETLYCGSGGHSGDAAERPHAHSVQRRFPRL